MPKHLLLINPWIYDFTAFDLWSKPLGLLYIASFLRDRDFSVSFIDCLDKYNTESVSKIRRYGTGHLRREEIAKPIQLNHIPRKYARYGISEDDFINKLKTIPEPDAILVTSIMTYWYLGPKRVVEIAREIFPGKPVILGGIYATLLPEHAREVIKPDYVITGPGEIKILKLLYEIFDLGFNPDSIFKNLDDYPYPAFDLILHPDYLIVMTARGCPYDCSFCAQKQIAMPFTQREPQKVVDELVYHYRKFHLRDFAFYDDALFIGRDQHIKIILDKIIDTRLPFRFHSPNGLFARYIDEELAQLMFRANFKTIRISFETSNENRRKDMFNKISNDGMVKAVENLEKAGYRRSDLDAYVIMGLPGQTLEEVIGSIIFVNNLGVQVRLASYSPIPGTLDFNRAVAAGLIPHDIDPLLTNKSIFPLNNAPEMFSVYRKVRDFAQMLNLAAQKSIAPFVDRHLASAVHAVLKEMA